MPVLYPYGMGLLKEKWVPIMGYERRYEVSNLGRVRNSQGRILATRPTVGGYLRVSLSHDNCEKEFVLHRLVAETFIGPLKKGFVTDHKNGDKTDSRASNLQYITSRQNTLKGKTVALNPNKTSRYPGVGRHGRGNNLWRARIKIGDKRVLLGLFKSEREAGMAYRDKLKEIEG